MCYYFHDRINGTKTNFNNILLDKKIYENISVYKISYKIPTGPKSLRIRLDKINGFIIIDDKIKHSILFHYGLFNNISDKIKYFLSKSVVLQIALIIIWEKSELIQIILYQQKKNIDFS